MESRRKHTAKEASLYFWRHLAAQPIASEGRGIMRVVMAVDDSGFVEDLLRTVVVGIRHWYSQTARRRIP